MHKTVIFVCALGLLCFSGSAQAQLQGGLDVFLYLAAGVSPAPRLAGYDVMLAVEPADSGVALADAVQTDPSGPHPPVFPSGSPFVFPNGGNEIQVSDFLLAGSEIIDDGDGLFRLVFAVEPGTVGMFQVRVLRAWTSLSDELGDPIPYTTVVDGTITVDAGGNVSATPVSLLVVPEPTVGLLLLAGGGLLLARRRQRAA